MSVALRVPLQNTNLSPLALRAKMVGIDIDAHGTFCEIYRGHDAIRVSHRHHIYIPDIIDSFDYYFDAVEPVPSEGKRVVDYSMPGFHRVKGFDFLPVMFNAFAEPISTTRQYLEAAHMPKGGTVLDLGGYSGLTSMVFALEVGREGRVVCLEVDKYNLATVHANLFYFGKLKQDAAPIAVEEKAVWTHNDGVRFSAEGNMGSAVTDATGRGESVLVPSITLSEIARQHALTRIDFIKCDIEGSEALIFEHEQEFLRKFRPRMVIEAHWLEPGRLSKAAFAPHLESAGYQLTEIAQDGCVLPLVVAVPTAV